MMLSLLLSCFQSKTPEQATPEETWLFPERTYSSEIHGVIREDPFAWLMEKENPDVQAIVQLENERFSEYQSAYSSLYEALVSEMLERQEIFDEPIEFQQGEWNYFSKRTKDYHQILRKKDGDKPEMLIDLDALSTQHPFVYLSSWEPSADNQILFYVIDTTGNNQYDLVLFDMEKKDVIRIIPAISENVLWLNDSEIIYVSQDERGVQHTVFLYDIEDNQIKILYQETELAARIRIEDSLSGRFVFLCSDSEMGSQIMVWDREKERSKFQMLWERQKNVQVTATEFQGNFLIQTNDTHPNNRILEIDGADFSTQTEWMKASEDTKIQSVIGLSSFVVVWQEEGYGELFQVIDSAGNEEVFYQKQGEVIDKSGISYDYDENTVTVPFPTMNSEGSEVIYSLAEETQTHRPPEYRSEYDFSEYVERDIFTTSDDGHRIPITIFHHQDLDLFSSPQPTYLETYSSYGYSFDRGFSPYRISLVQRGVLFAYCHARGSSFYGKTWHKDDEDYGEAWHQGGAGLHRQNAISDLIACGKELQKRGWSAPEKTVISAESAGGTIIGGAINQAPELWKAAILERPFVDLITVLSDETNTQNPEEWQEWGNPAEKDVFDAMSKYSPYDNIIAHVYPEIFVTSGWNDPYVQYWEATKLVGKLRKYHTGAAKILLYTDMTGGHFGAQSNTGIVEDRARVYSFALNQMGITE